MGFNKQIPYSNFVFTRYKRNCYWPYIILTPICLLVHTLYNTLVHTLYSTLTHTLYSSLEHTLYLVHVLSCINLRINIFALIIERIGFT